ncbi:MAG: hypothetical protein GY740_08850, partial [Gammaproteobacteria bacterium]|nr:hypothetical protein [Gammaproteobacteria bacterium]
MTGTFIKCYGCGQFGHIQRNCPRPPAQGAASGGVKSAVMEDVKSVVDQPTEAETWAQFVSGWNNCCKTVVLNASESSSHGTSTGLATRRVPRLSIDIEGVSL